MQPVGEVIVNYRGALRTHSRRALQHPSLGDLWRRLDRCLTALSDLADADHHFRDENATALPEILVELELETTDFQRDQTEAGAEGLIATVSSLESLLAGETVRAVTTYASKVAPLIEGQVAISERIESAEGQVRRLNVRASELIAKNGTKFREHVKEIAAQSEELMARQRKGYDARLGELGNYIHTARGQLDEEIAGAKAASARLSDDLVDLEERLDLVRNGIASSAYLRASETELESANQLRRIAMILMGAVGALVAVLTLLPLWFDTTQTIEAALVRFLMVFTLLIPAGYASRESSSHRSRAEDYRLRGMGILAVQNYIHDMPSGEAVELKKVLAERYLGVLSPIEGESSASGTTDLLQLAEKLRGIVANQ